MARNHVLQFCRMLRARVCILNYNKNIISPHKHFNKDKPVGPRHNCHASPTSTEISINIFLQLIHVAVGSMLRYFIQLYFKVLATKCKINYNCSVKMTFES